MSDKKKSLKDWATEAEALPTRKCETCANYPHLLEEIAEVTLLQIEGKVSISRKQLWHKLVDDYDYGLSSASFDRHIVNCVTPNLKKPEKK
jgi:hypothetical protein